MADLLTEFEALGDVSYRVRYRERAWHYLWTVEKEAEIKGVAHLFPVQEVGFPGLYERFEKEQARLQGKLHLGASGFVNLSLMVKGKMAGAGLLDNNANQRVAWKMIGKVVEEKPTAIDASNTLQDKFGYGHITAMQPDDYSEPREAMALAAGREPCFTPDGYSDWRTNQKKGMVAPLTIDFLDRPRVEMAAASIKKTGHEVGSIIISNIIFHTSDELKKKSQVARKDHTGYYSQNLPEGAMEKLFAHLEILAGGNKDVLIVDSSLKRTKAGWGFLEFVADAYTLDELKREYEKQASQIRLKGGRQ